MYSNYLNFFKKKCIVSTNIIFTERFELGLHKIIIVDFCHKQCLLLESFFLKQFFTGKLFLFHFHFKRRALQTLVRMGEGKRKRHRKFVCLFVSIQFLWK